MIKKHEFVTADGEKATLVFKNTLHGSIVESTLREKFVSNGAVPEINQEMPHHVHRSNFCYVTAYCVEVIGLDWEPVSYDATEEEFLRSLHRFAFFCEDGTTLYDCARAVVDMFVRTDPIEKPDHQMTADEQADPN